MFYEIKVGIILYKDKKSSSSCFLTEKNENCREFVEKKSSEDADILRSSYMQYFYLVPKTLAPSDENKFTSIFPN